MKKFTKTFEEFIGDETVDSLRKKAIEVQQKEGDKIYVDPAAQGGDAGIGEPDNDGSGDEMGSTGGDD